MAIRGLSFLLLVAVLAGCERPASPAPSIAPPGPIVVQTVTPTLQPIGRTIAQPASIQAFEQTPIYAKVPGYVLKWDVDIGDEVKKDQPLAELWIPEYASELQLKKEQVELAKKGLAVAEAMVATAKAQVREADAGLARAEAVHDYWKGQSEHFAKLVNASVLDRQTKEDTHNQFRMAAAALTEAQARTVSAKAFLAEKEAARDKAAVDIRAAEAARQRQADLVRYGLFVAPYDGVVTKRNVNTFDFVQPPTAGKGESLYVIERRDLMRVFVEVPEIESAWIKKGTPARVRVPALPGREFIGKIERTSYSLDKTTRTLLAEIDLPNPHDDLRPGMYAYAQVDAQSPKVLTLPAGAVASEGDVNVGFKYFCCFVESGKIKRADVLIGARNDKLVEVQKKWAPGNAGPWMPFSGNETVVNGNLSGLKDGQAVELK